MILRRRLANHTPTPIIGLLLGFTLMSWKVKSSGFDDARNANNAGPDGKEPLPLRIVFYKDTFYKEYKGKDSRKGAKEHFLRMEAIDSIPSLPGKEISAQVWLDAPLTPLRSTDRIPRKDPKSIPFDIFCGYCGYSRTNIMIGEGVHRGSACLAGAIDDLFRSEDRFADIDRTA